MFLLPRYWGTLALLPWLVMAQEPASSQGPVTPQVKMPTVATATTAPAKVGGAIEPLPSQPVQQQKNQQISEKAPAAVTEKTLKPEAEPEAVVSSEVTEPVSVAEKADKEAVKSPEEVVSEKARRAQVADAKPEGQDPAASAASGQAKSAEIAEKEAVAKPLTKPAPEAQKKVAIKEQSKPEPIVEEEDPYGAVQIYREDDLLKLINKGLHLERVVLDECQLVQDIEARALVMKLPAYRFLWGNMLAEGVCVDSNVALGFDFIWRAARQGLPEALAYLGHAYATGTMVKQNAQRAMPLMIEAASLGYRPARVELVELLLEGYGSPLDYEKAYYWLLNSVGEELGGDEREERLLDRLALKMPPEVVERIKNIE
ncbi:tetratricopeptide repeat protein [Dongshaea marina]|uniref:tetratricopeptide repeat protein n=1 Tax=Dongshaea marina TaxID=2047966 RepID=UPI001F34F8AF|nr:sel1 repeat family protein [Dongshaea marina]